MPGGAWKKHVLEALERREGRTGRLRGLLEQHEKLRDRLETLLRGAGPGTEHRLEVLELRRDRQELRQQLGCVSETLARSEAESREQRARMQRLVQNVGALQQQCRELQDEASVLSREAEGLRRELDQAQNLLQDAHRERQALEAHWVREKALEAERLNRAFEQEAKYQQKVSRLREKLQKARLAGAAQAGPGTAASRTSRSSASWEAPEMAEAEGQPTPTSTSSPHGRGQESSPQHRC